MQKYLVLYKTPVAVLKEWMETNAETREVEQKKLEDEWNEWMKAHSSELSETAGAGKTKVVTTEGVSDIKNDVMLYSFVEAESHEAAAELFVGHPHLKIPQSTIEVMTITKLPDAS